MIENILPYICHVIFLLLHLHKTHLLTQERRTRGRDKIKQKPSLHSPHCFKNFQNNIAPYPCKGIQGGLGFRIPGTGCQSVELGFWVPIVGGIPDSLRVIVYSKSPGFRIPQAEFSTIPDSRSKIPVHSANNKAPQ